MFVSFSKRKSLNNRAVPPSGVKIAILVQSWGGLKLHEYLQAVSSVIWCGHSHRHFQQADIRAGQHMPIFPYKIKRNLGKYVKRHQDLKWFSNLWLQRAQFLRPYSVACAHNPKICHDGRAIHISIYVIKKSVIFLRWIVPADIW
jgi:hypothetical protein